MDPYVLCNMLDGEVALIARVPGDGLVVNAKGTEAFDAFSA